MYQTTTTTYTQDQKIDMIFKFLFDQKNAEQEENFWNRLTDDEVNELRNIEKEKTISFSDFLRKHNA